MLEKVRIIFSVDLGFHVVMGRAVLVVYNTERRISATRAGRSPADESRLCFRRGGSIKIMSGLNCGSETGGFRIWTGRTCVTS